MNVVFWHQLVHVTRFEPPLLRGFEGCFVFGDSIVGAREHNLILLTAVETDNAPRQVVVDRCRCVFWHHQTGKGQPAIAGPVEQPHADAAAHATPCFRFHELVREPSWLVQQFGEVRGYGTQYRARVGLLGPDLVHVPDETNQVGMIVKVLLNSRCRGWNRLTHSSGSPWRAPW